MLATLILHALCASPGDPPQGTTEAPKERSALCVRVLEPAAGKVHDIDVSPDGARILVGCDNGHAYVYDRASGELIHDLYAGPGAASDVEFDPRGARLLVVQPARTRVWNATTFASERTLEGQKHGMFRARFSPDGKRVATGSIGNGAEPTAESEARLWDLAIDEPIAVVPGQGFRVKPEFSPDGATLLVSCESSSDLTLARLDGNHAPRIFEGPAAHVAHAAWSPDGKALLTVWTDNVGRLWNVATGNVTRVLEGHTGYMLLCGFNRDGSECSTTSWVDRTTRIWRAQSGKERLVLKGHGDRPTCAAFAPDGRAFASADASGQALLFELEKGAVAARYDGHTDIVSALEFTPDSKFVVTGAFDGTVRIWTNVRAK